MKERSEFLILGCGYTARRVACKLLSDGAKVVCTNRSHRPLTGAECIVLDAANLASLLNLTKHLTPHMTVLHSVPPLDGTDLPQDFTSQLLDTLRPFAPVRIVYISTTGVYGVAQMVDDRTPAAPITPRDRLRVEVENLIESGPWSHLILRPAAIYGPGRGVHNAVKRGTFEVPKDSRTISRIHVDDLTLQVVAGLRSNLTGAFPVADEEPCRSIDVAMFTAQLLNLPQPMMLSGISTEVAGRWVDGAAYRLKSGTALQYPSYREGIPACLAAEL